MAWSTYSTPGAWFGAGYVADDTGHTVLFNTNDASSNKTFVELTDTEAAETTGDVRKVIFAIMEQLFTKYNSLATADRPTKMTFQKSTAVNNTTGVVTNTYTVRIMTSIVTQEVVAEA